MKVLFPALALFLGPHLVQGEDLQPVPVSTNANQEATPPNDLYSLVDQQAQTEADWKSWPLDPSKGAQASLETTAVIIDYPFNNITFKVYAYQLPDGAAALPWVTYVWVDRGKKYQTKGLSPTPLMVCAVHNAERWRSLDSITPPEWAEINRITKHVTELPLPDQKGKTQARRLRVTQRVHPATDRLITQGGVASIHELTWSDGTPLAIVETGRVAKPEQEERHP
jgi:hypothetical protein